MNNLGKKKKKSDNQEKESPLIFVFSSVYDPQNQPSH